LALTKTSNPDEIQRMIDYLLGIPSTPCQQRFAAPAATAQLAASLTDMASFFAAFFPAQNRKLLEFSSDQSTRVDAYRRREPSARS
jgi:hypothetical protein